MPKQFSVRQHGWYWHIYSDDECVSDTYTSREDAEAEAQARQCEADEQTDIEATWKEIDEVYRSVARLYDADKPATDPRNFAVGEVLDAIASLGRPRAEDDRAAA